MDRTTLICLSHAGGSATRYYSWATRLEPHLRVEALELRGRGIRSSANLYGSAHEAISDLTHAALKLVANGSSYIIFGHSMGAYLAVEIERRLETLGHVATHLFLSGRDSPRYKNVLTAPVNELSNEDLIRDLSALGGIPEELSSDELMETYFIPILRADFRLLEQLSSTIDESVPVRSPLCVLNGQEDVGQRGISGSEWMQITAGQVTFHNFPGGHFYLNSHEPEIFKLILVAATQLPREGSI